MKVHKPSAILLGISVFLLVAGIVLYLCIPYIIYALVSKELPFSNSSLSFKMWRDIPFPIYQQVYFFNITNADDFLQFGAKPDFVEVGPYTYSAKFHKHNLTWNTNNTITFREVKTFYFERNLSAGSDDDIIHTINGPMVVAATLAESFSPWKKIAISFLFFLLGEKLVIQKTVKELTYSGYKDPIIMLAPLFYPSLPYRDGKFSWLYKKNSTDDGLFNVFTGHGDVEKINFIDKYNREKKLHYWTDEYCGMFNGTNAELNRPLFTGDTIHVFNPLLCRSWPLTYQEPSETLNIPSRRFVAKRKLLENGTDNPANGCYNVGKNLPSGTLDVSPCNYGAPAILSYPHFYLADASYLKAVKGMHPDASKHTFFIDVEPNSGFPVNAAIRIQLNLYLHRIPEIWPFSKLSSTPLVFPVFWQELTFYLDNDIAEKFEKMLIKPLMYTKIGIIVVIAVGGLLSISALIAIIIIYRKQKLKENDDVEPLTINDADDTAYGNTNEITKENGRVDAKDDDEPVIRDI